MKLNGRAVNLFRDAKSKQFVQECTIHPCTGLTCKNGGKCAVKNSGKNIFCYNISLIYFYFQAILESRIKHNIDMYVKQRMSISRLHIFVLFN